MMIIPWIFRLPNGITTTTFLGLCAYGIHTATTSNPRFDLCPCKGAPFSGDYERDSLPLYRIRTQHTMWRNEPIRNNPRVIDTSPRYCIPPLRMIAARWPLAPSEASTGGWPLYFLHCLILANIGAFRSMFGTIQKTIWFPRM